MEVDSLASQLRVTVNEELVQHEDGSGPKVRFLRVEISNTRPVVEAAIARIADTFWANEVVDEFIRQGFLTRAQSTIDSLAASLESAIDNAITSSTGEYVVSITAHCIVEAIYEYKALPLAEIIKEKKSGSPGFDYHHEKDGLLLLFGEAKYTSAGNAYNNAFKQIVGHVAAGKDEKEAVDLAHFITDDTKTNFLSGKKGFTAAFSTKGKSFDVAKLKDGIIRNDYFGKLLEHEELVVVAVDINE
jgi:hypothetical protein